MENSVCESLDKRTERRGCRVPFYKKEESYRAQGSEQRSERVNENVGAPRQPRSREFKVQQRVVRLTSGART